MKHYQSILIKTLCIVLCGIFGGLAGAKPLSPVQVSITPKPISGQWQVIEFLVRASVTVDTENLQLVVSVPQSLTVVDGELSWQGALSKGQEKLLRFTASLAATAVGATDDILIQIHAAIVDAATSVTSAAQQDAKIRNPARLAANAFYRWPTGAVKAKAAAIHSQPLSTRVVDRGALKVQEYQLRP